MITTLKTATQFALSLASQLQNAQDNTDVLADASAWHDLADDLRKLVVYADSRAAALDADAYAADTAIADAATPDGLTANEATVFAALRQNAFDEAGGDFAITERVNVKALGLTKQQFGALLTTLQAKGHIGVDVTYVNGDYRSKGTKVTQVTFYPGLNG